LSENAGPVTGYPSKCFKGFHLVADLRKVGRTTADLLAGSWRRRRSGI